MVKRAAIVGWAHTRFGKLVHAESLEALFGAVARSALEHAGVAPADVDFATVGVFNNGFSRQGFEAGLLSQVDPGLRCTPAVRVENAGATGSAALFTAMDFIESGRGRIALVVGAEKMTALSPSRLSKTLLSGCYRMEEEGEGGLAGAFARIAVAYFHRHGDRSEEMALIAAKNYANGALNPYVSIQRAFDFEFCSTVSERNPFVAGALRKTDWSVPTDGAAALVIADTQTAASLQRSVGCRSRAQVNDYMPLSRRDPVAFDGAHRAWNVAKRDARVRVEDLSFVETHDCCTLAELIQYEAMGLAKPGEGWRVIREGITYRDGKVPANPSGGLKAMGHPLGATGVSMHVMAAMQLCGEAGGMQLPVPQLAGVFNMGGAGVTNYVSILERCK